MKKNKKDLLKRKQFSVQESIFDRTVHVFLNFPMKEFGLWCKKQKAENWEENCLDNSNICAFSTEIDGKEKPTEWIIFIKKFHWTIDDQNTLIHEIVHTIIKIWKVNNIQYNDHTQEFLAHSIGNLYGDISAKFFNYKK